jgi:hypothetical protein
MRVRGFGLLIIHSFIPCGKYIKYIKESSLKADKFVTEINKKTAEEN